MYSCSDDFLELQEMNESQNVKESVIKLGNRFLTKKLISPKTNMQRFLQSNSFQAEKH